MKHRKLSLTTAMAVVFGALPAGTVAASECQVLEAAAEGGRYCTDALGVEARFRTSHTWEVPLLAPGTVILQDADVPPPVSALLLMRGTLDDGSTDSAAGWTPTPASPSRPVGPPRSAATRVMSTTFRSRLASTRSYASEDPIGRIVVREGESYRVWFIDLGTGDPLVGFAPVASGDEGWLAKADEIMASLELGAMTETPAAIADAPAQAEGTYTVDGFSLGQLSFALPAPAEVIEVHPGFVVVDATGTGAGVAFMAPRQTADGVALPDAAAVHAAFGAATEMSILSSTAATIMGERVEAIAAADRSAIPGLSPDAGQPDFVATPPPYGYDFVFETSSGPMLVGVFANQEGDLPAAGDFFEQLAESITLS